MTLRFSLAAVTVFEIANRVGLEALRFVCAVVFMKADRRMSCSQEENSETQTTN